jgi:hypothetical protein
MKLTIEIDDRVFKAIKDTGKNFGITPERAAGIMLSDWVARLDAEFFILGKPATCGYRSFDWQFLDGSKGFKDSYQYSRGIHVAHVAEKQAVFAMLADSLEKEDAVVNAHAGEG